MNNGRIAAVESEQSVLGALINDNEALGRVSKLSASHFYQPDHRTIFAELAKQISAGKRCDVITLADALGSRIKDCLPYVHSLSSNVASSANIERYAKNVIDRALRREVIGLGKSMAEVASESVEGADAIIDRFAGKLDELVRDNAESEPETISDSLSDYVDLLQARMDGTIKPISTGFAELDRQMDGGLERGTVTVVAGRPGMGKTAFGLCLARNVSFWGSSLFFSMEMPRNQVNDRNIAALGKLPITWLRKPDEAQKEMWDRLTHACVKAQEMSLRIDYKPSLTILEIRSRARTIKRRHGLDLLVIDQLSFLTGGVAENKANEIGEYTRGLLALAKELDVAVVLLCQLNRDCEKRVNKRPILADLSSSGSIEQDASNIIFLYRDELYNLDTQDKDVCEVIIPKQRQGAVGTVALRYISSQTRFENLDYRWQPPKVNTKSESRNRL